MSKIGDLKANENNKVNLVKILELFCNGDTKYVEMLLKLYKTNGDSPSIKVNAIGKKTGIEINRLKELTDNEIEIMYRLSDNNMLMSHIKVFQKFINYNEKKLIDDNDLQSYKSFAEISHSVKKAEEKIALKELEKQIKKIYEDNEWLILIPLTYESSVKYGYNTKWCTASETTKEHYTSYTRDGLLIYIIEKGKNKTAVYKKKNNNEISFWNQTDARIDSIQTNFPPNIMEIIKTALNTTYDIKNKPYKDKELFINDICSISNDYIDEMIKDKKSIFGNLYDESKYYDTYLRPDKWGASGIYKNDGIDSQLLYLNSPEYFEKIKNLINGKKNL